MSSKRLTFLGCATLSLSILTAQQVRAQEAAAPEGEAAAAVVIDPALQAEIRYIEALIDWGLADFASDVIDATKKKWPESEAQLFAYEIRRLLLEGKFDEAEKRIAELKDRKGPKYWAARLEVANNYFYHDKREECGKIYDEFFANNKKPGKELMPLMRDAMYNRIQLLRSSNRREEAAATYVDLLALLDPKGNKDDDNAWCNGACEAAELFLSLAAEKAQKDRKANLQAAKKFIDKLLWRQDMLIYFGRAIAMKAYWELLNGSVDKAQGVIEDYKDNLQYIHDELLKADPDGSAGWLRQSPMPQCRYLMAEKYWKEAQEEYKKPKRDDEKVKTLLFGAKTSGGKRNGQGAFNNAVNVYLRFPQSVWAPAAGRLQKEISAFVLEKYGKAPVVHSTPEQERQVLEAQFHSAKEKFAERDWQGAIDDYFSALRNYPEEDLSVAAVRNIATSYLNLADEEQNKAKKEGLLLCAAAVEGYLAERFGGVRTIKANKFMMIEAGSGATALAARERASGRRETADDIYRTFLKSYTYHPEAARQGLSLGFEPQKKALELLKDKDADNKEEVDRLLREALSWYSLVETYYKRTKAYPQALYYSSNCYEKLGDNENAIKYLEAFTATIDETQRPLARFQSELAVAVLHQKLGAMALEEADAARREAAALAADESEAGVQKREAAQARAEAKSNAGTEEIKKCLLSLHKLAPRAKDLVASPNLDATSKKKALDLRESALFMMADGWSRLTYPADKVADYMKKSIENLEAYITEYPQGRYAKTAYARLGRHYCIVGEVEKGKEALTRLKAQFPDSNEAKKAMPQLASSLIAYAAKLPADDANRKTVLDEARKTYREMIDANGQYSPMDYMRAAEVLVSAKDWSLAANAYDKAESVSGTNAAYRTVVARARLGKAGLFLAQDQYGLAREALDDFMNDEKMSRMRSVTNACDMLAVVAMHQGEQEEDEQKRRKHYAAAIGAVKQLRNYWKNDESIQDWQRDRVELMSSDISISRMGAESSFGNEEAVKKACGDAVKKLETFVKSKTAAGRIDLKALNKHDVANLEKAYSDLVRVLAKMGEAQMTDVAFHGSQYKRYFPQGPHISEVEAAIKVAVANGAKIPTEDELDGKVSPKEDAEPPAGEEAVTTAAGEPEASSAEPTEEKSEDAPAAEAKEESEEETTAEDAEAPAAAKEEAPAEGEAGAGEAAEAESAE